VYILLYGSLSFFCLLVVLRKPCIFGKNSRRINVELVYSERNQVSACIINNFSNLVCDWLLVQDSSTMSLLYSRG